MLLDPQITGNPAWYELVFIALTPVVLTIAVALNRRRIAQNKDGYMMTCDHGQAEAAPNTVNEHKRASAAVWRSPLSS